MTQTPLSGRQNHTPALQNSLFHCSWQRVLFLHYRVAPQFLQPQVPFDLDLHDAQAYVSLVAFTLCNMRLNHPHLKFVTQPLHTHAFLNVRTYVRVGNMPGIYFLAEWLNNRLATMLGPILYGLPYRFGQLNYHHNPCNGSLRGQVTSLSSPIANCKLPIANTLPNLRYHASLPTSAIYQPASADTLTHFLLERYIAFTKHGPFRRLFHVWHDPWPQTPIQAEIESNTLLHQTGPWFAHAHFLFANFSPGLSSVQMSWPQRLTDNSQDFH